MSERESLEMEGVDLCIWLQNAFLDIHNLLHGFSQVKQSLSRHSQLVLGDQLLHLFIPCICDIMGPGVSGLVGLEQFPHFVLVFP
jgi:hypothetical protein